MNYQKMNNSRLPEMWAGEQERVLGETESILGEQAYEDVLATVIINKVRQKVLGSIRASSKIISLPAKKKFFFWSFKQFLQLQM